MNFKEDLVIRKMYEATTDKGFTLKYKHVGEDKIVYYNSNIRYNEEECRNSDDEPEVPHPTLFKVECNFEITPEMIKRLHSSKIMHIVGFDNCNLPQKSFLYFQAKRMFSYQSLKEVFSDMCVHFELQSPLKIDENAQDKD